MRTFVVKDNKSGAVQDDVIQLGGVSPLDVLVTANVATGLTATGTIQGDALLLAAEINVIGTAAASTGVILPDVTSAFVGQRIVIKNQGANTINVFPQVGGDIDGAGANTAITLATTIGATFYATSANTWSELP